MSDIYAMIGLGPTLALMTAVLSHKIRPVRRPLADERGVAMPLAMVMLVVLSALMLSFAVLGKSEPSIAANQLQTAQSLRLADSGLQLAIWALDNSTDPGGKGIDLTSLAYGGHATGNYDGTHLIALGGTGGFTVLVEWQNPTNATYERTVTAVGWNPSNGSTLNSHRKIQAVVQLGVVPPLDPPCVVCVNGEVQVNGSAAAFNTSVGGCGSANPPATAVQTAASDHATLTYNASPTFTGFGTSGVAATTTTSNASQFEYNSDALAKFKAYAQAQGTYYKGAVTSLPTGTGPYVVYIDTVDGSDFTSSTPTSNDGSLTLSSNLTFNGTVIVAGTINLSGTVTFNGLLYSLNDLSMSGHVTVNGAVVSENRRDTSSTSIDSDFSGNITMTYNCTNVRNSTINLLGNSWVVKTGGYQETSGY
jgi:hypothetical protein